MHINREKKNQSNFEVHTLVNINPSVIIANAGIYGAFRTTNLIITRIKKTLVSTAQCRLERSYARFIYRYNRKS